MKQRICGMSLIELMLALLLGTLVVASAIAVFVANQKAMTTSRGLGQIQQHMQVALELLSRDLRQAGGNPCSQHLPLANIITAPTSRWWTNLISIQNPDETWNAPWRNTSRGLTVAEFAAGTGAGARVTGSDAIEILSADTNIATVVSHDGTRFVLNTSAHGFSSGNLLLVCDLRQAGLFQGTVSGANITHPATEMNCSRHLGLAEGCNAAPFTYAPHALIARWNPVRWYLGDNGRDGTSLYRMTLEGNGESVTRQEMVEDITALEFRYLLAGASEAVPLSGVGGRWDEVVGVRINITASGNSRVEGEPLQRNAVHAVHLRNRSP